MSSSGVFTSYSGLKSLTGMQLISLARLLTNGVHGSSAPNLSGAGITSVPHHTQHFYMGLGSQGISVPIRLSPVHKGRSLKFW